MRYYRARYNYEKRYLITVWMRTKNVKAVTMLIVLRAICIKHRDSYCIQFTPSRDPFTAAFIGARRADIV